VGVAADSSHARIGAMKGFLFNPALRSPPTLTSPLEGEGISKKDSERLSKRRDDEASHDAPHLAYFSASSIAKRSMIQRSSAATAGLASRSGAEMR